MIRGSTYSQIYPLLFDLLIFYLRPIKIGSEPPKDVTVHKTLEKDGITTEVVTAKTGNALYNYLLNKGLNIQYNSITIFDNYIGKDYSFVVSWVSSRHELAKDSYRYDRQPGIFITFPTNKIYYPLIPTSVYGNIPVPITIYVLDYVKPKTYEKIKNSIKVSYFVEEYISTSGAEKFFGNIDRSYVKYTKIKIDAPSKYFVEDLWFENRAPLTVGIAYAVCVLTYSKPLLLILISLVLISLISGGFAGFVVYRDIKKFALIGLTNIFTIIGLTITMVFVKNKSVDEELKNKMEKLGLIVIDKRKLSFIILFSISYVVISFLLYSTLISLL